MGAPTIGEYKGEVKDRVENFHGNQVVYIHWEDHLMFCAAFAVPVPPAMPFGALVDQVIPTLFGVHPDFAKIEWSEVLWNIDGTPAKPEKERSLSENQIGHKSTVRFSTPGLRGIGGSGS